MRVEDNSAKMEVPIFRNFLKAVLIIRLLVCYQKQRGNYSFFIYEFFVKIAMSTTFDYYLALDGDDVGHRLEYYMITNDLKALQSFSKTFASALLQLESKLVVEFNAHIIFVGGDNLLAKIPDRYFDIVALQNIQNQFLKESEVSLSFGIGKSPRESYIALNFAKVSGKNCIKFFEELSNE